MPIQAQNTLNQDQNTIRDITKNSPKIHTQSQHSEFWTTVKNGLVRLIDLPLTWALQNKILYGGSTKTSLTNDLNREGPSRKRGQE